MQIHEIVRTKKPDKHSFSVGDTVFVSEGNTYNGLFGEVIAIYGKQVKVQFVMGRNTTPTYWYYYKQLEKVKRTV